MFRPASRALLRAPTVPIRAPASKRLISTNGHSEKSRSWKNSAVRLGLAIGAVYYYNTSPIFAEHSLFSSQKPRSESANDSSAPTLDSITPRIRHERAAQAPHKASDAQKNQTPSDAAMKSPEELEEEAGQEAAFDPETGEINWDCPCLGGMAHGPCGEEFKAAFSCFVFSKEEPKGMDCIEKFKGMQDCFRQHPDVYGPELEDDEEAPAGEAQGGEHPPASQIDASSDAEEKRTQAKEVKSEMEAKKESDIERAESEALLPKAWHDTEDKNADTKATRTEK